MPSGYYTFKQTEAAVAVLHKDVLPFYLKQSQEPSPGLPAADLNQPGTQTVSRPESEATLDTDEYRAGDPSGAERRLLIKLNYFIPQIPGSSTD
jgi:hypothetical protein